MNYEYIYDEYIGQLGMILVKEKLLPNELSLYHYEIAINIETVQIDVEEELIFARERLLSTYNDLINDSRFKGNLTLENDIIKIKGRV